MASIPADVYLEAAGEHARSANDHYLSGRWVLAHYLSGLAVECVLRAYRVRLDPEFDSRHNIKELFRLAKFADVIPPSRTEKASDVLTIVISQWSNSHRFPSEAALRTHFVSRGMFKNIKGDFMKELSRRIVDSSNTLVTIGVARWKK